MILHSENLESYYNHMAAVMGRLADLLRCLVMSTI